MYLEIIYLIYMYKKDLALNNPQWLIWHKNQTKLKYRQDLVLMHLRQGWSHCGPMHCFMRPAGASKTIKNKHLHLNRDNFFGF